MKKAQVLFEYMFFVLLTVMILIMGVKLFTNSSIAKMGGGSLWTLFQNHTIHVRPMTR